jgi:hypothetical protein
MTMVRQTDPELYAELRAFKARYGLKVPAQYGAHAWGIGRKVVEGRPTDELVLRFYVDPEQPGGGPTVPPVFVFTSLFTGDEVRVGTDVIETPRVTFEQVDPEAVIRPVPGGVSFGPHFSTGTLGGWCRDSTDGTIVALSNEHVLGSTGGLPTLQPGPGDGGTERDHRIGTTKRGILRNSPPAMNQVDCAIADIDDRSNADLRVLEISPAIYAIDTATLDLFVEKYGQTTQHTYGRVDDLDWQGGAEGFYFEDCMFIVPIAPSGDWSGGGDSGALVFSQTPVADDIKPVVGLHFGGSGVNGVACKIGSVFQELDLTTF